MPAATVCIDGFCTASEAWGRDKLRETNLTIKQLNHIKSKIILYRREVYDAGHHNYP
jgi:hypothetical protein